MNGHTCHARGCDIQCDPSKLMCWTHWKMVPWSLGKRVWDTYRPGQEIDKRPSPEYLEAAQNAISAVAAKEAAR